MYAETDIHTTVDGDLSVFAGDLQGSSSAVSLVRTINFCLLTEYSDYNPHKNFGASPDRFIGRPNDGHTRNMIKLHISQRLNDQGILDWSNHSLEVVSVGNHEIAIILKIKEPIMELITSISSEDIILAYKYDFNNGTLEAVA